MERYLGLHLALTIWRLVYVSANYADVEQLREDLLANHSSGILPISKPSERIQLNIAVKISDVTFDGLRLTARVNMELSWLDQILQWRPIEHSAIDFIYPKSSEIWMPAFDVVNSFDRKFECATSRLKLSSTGNVNYICHGNVKVSCRTQFVKYPFDEHECDVVLYPTDFQAKEVEFIVSRLDSVEEGKGEWTFSCQIGIGERSMSFDYSVSAVTITLRLKRDFIYVIMFSVAPMVLLSLLNLLTFWIPDKSVKVYYTITILLITAIVVTPETKQLPRTSNCAFNIYWCALFLLNIVTINVAVTLWRREYKDSKEDEESEDMNDPVFDFRNPNNGIFKGKISRHFQKGCLPWCSNKVEDSTEANIRVKRKSVTEETSRKSDHRLALGFFVIWCMITSLYLIKIIGIV